ncbi:cytochrome c oxidase assembly protein [Microbacterium album]|uniref:Membrane protein n=1 Tax=Microbacterium album TaxID=2053191 RepID=A0A917II06_9MICO|nr:cytochrome c oxidase assembly protein [Microbacterium album]GGH50501.1 membrane protein [Microbacterium album]
MTGEALAAAHAGHGGLSLDAVLVLCAAIATAAYLAGTVASRRRGRPWPLHRAVLWCAGIAAATISVAGPLAQATHESFVAHTWAHLLGGMLAPLLLALAAPVTLALRSLAPTPARRISRLLRSLPARFLVHPVTAAVLTAGGLWLIYLTPVHDAMRASALVHILVHGHLLLAGFVFAVAILSTEPSPHRAPRVLRAVVLILAVASHAILAKHLYAHPPAGLAVDDVRAGAQLMYYAGAGIEAALIALFCAGWYREAGRARTRGGEGRDAPLARLDG